VRHHRGASFVNGVVGGFDGPACGTPFERPFNGPCFTSDSIVTLCDAIGCCARPATVGRRRRGVGADYGRRCAFSHGFSPNSR
jgi:hypothetical protein